MVARRPTKNRTSQKLSGSPRELEGSKRHQRSSDFNRSALADGRLVVQYGSGGDVTAGRAPWRRWSRGWTIDYSIAGRGPAVLLVVGLSQWADQWSELGYVDALKDDFQVLTVDTLGHGRSDKPHGASAYDQRGLVSDLVAALDREEIATVTAWGFSFGVQHVTDLASVAPSRVRSLVCGGGDLRAPRDEELANAAGSATLLRAPGGLVAMWQSVGYVGEEPVAVGLAHNDVEALACACEARPRWRPELDTFAMPTLAYWGTEENEPARLREALGPSFEWFEVPNADHYGAFERAEDVLARVGPFLERTAISSTAA